VGAPKTKARPMEDNQNPNHGFWPDRHQPRGSNRQISRSADRQIADGMNSLGLDTTEGDAVGLKAHCLKSPSFHRKPGVLERSWIKRSSGNSLKNRTRFFQSWECFFNYSFCERIFCGYRSHGLFDLLGTCGFVRFRGAQ
jgi:hypothetical protein